MKQVRREMLSAWIRYGLSLLAVVAATCLRLAMDPWVGEAGVPYVTFNAAVALAAFLWGRNPAIVATIVGGLACDYFVTPPRYTIMFYSAAQMAPMLFFMATGLLVSILAGHLHASRQLADERAQSLRQRAEELEREQAASALLAAIVESSDDAILSTSLDGAIMSWNAGAQRLFGYLGDEIVGKPITLLLPPDRVQEEQQILARLRRGERVERIEAVRVARDGRQIDVSVTMSPLMARDGRVVGASKIIHDITERKRAEKALERTAEELSRSNKDLAQFAYVASHDLQEPLRMVTGYLQLIDRRYKDRLDNDAREFIAYAVDGATRMSRLITDLLDFSRVNSRGRPPEPVRMDAILDRALDNLQMAIRDSGAQITHDPLPTVLGDGPQLVQLLQNLVGNAIKFRSPDRPIQVCIAAEKRDDEWVFSVRDNGIGIDPQYAEKIFLIFQRLHSRAEYPGTGIGLAICKRIVERHGGRIWVEGQAGQGSTFFFSLGSEEAVTR